MVAPQAALSRFGSFLKAASEVLSHLRSIVISLVVLLLSALLLAYLFSQNAQDQIVIRTVVVDENASQKGLSERQLSTALISRIEEIYRDSRPHFFGQKLVWESDLPTFVIPETEISIQTIVNAIGYVFEDRPKSMHIFLTREVDRDLHQGLRLRLYLDGHAAMETALVEEGDSDRLLGRLVADAADRILERTNPAMLAAFYTRNAELNEVDRRIRTSQEALLQRYPKHHLAREINCRSLAWVGALYPTEVAPTFAGLTETCELWPGAERTIERSERYALDAIVNETDTDDFWAYSLLGTIHLRRSHVSSYSFLYRFDQRNKAIGFYEIARTLDSSKALMYSQLATAHLLSCNLERTLAYLKNAADIDREDPLPLAIATGVYVFQRRFDEAVRVASEAIRANRHTATRRVLAALHWNRGEAYAMLDDFEKAQSDFRLASRLFPPMEALVKEATASIADKTYKAKFGPAAEGCDPTKVAKLL